MLGSWMGRMPKESQATPRSSPPRHATTSTPCVVHPPPIHFASVAGSCFWVFSGRDGETANHLRWA